jgi:hypothetical protein
MVLVVLGTIPLGEPIVEEVDVLEWNAVYDEKGKLVLTQWIFRDGRGEGQIAAWRWIKWHRAVRDMENGGWTLLFTDGEFFREIRAKSYRERWTQWDIEAHERDEWPKEKRKGLLFEKQGE